MQRAYKVIETKYRELREKEIGRTPPEVKNLLKTLCDEKMIKDDDYPRLIKYLHDRRRKQRSFYQRTNNIIPDFKNEIDLVFDTPGMYKDLTKQIKIKLKSSQNILLVVC